MNECYLCTKNGETLSWQKIGSDDDERPCIRASHSLVHFNGCCYIFGGQDDDNNKLCDLWELNLST